MMDSKMVNLRVDLELYNKLKKEAKENGLNISSYIRFILIKNLKKGE